MPQQNSNKPQLMEVHFVGELIQGLFQALALSIEVFLRREFGSGYVAGGVAVFFDMLIVAKCFPNDSAQPIEVFAGLYVLFWFFAGVGVFRRWWKSDGRLHRRYSGRPHLAGWLSNWKEMNVKHLEALAVTLLGYGVFHLNRPLGVYLMVAAIFVFLRDYAVASMIRQRAHELHDAVLEQKAVAEQFRQMQQE